ncbi:MAG: TetR/AcrR family transcriptional regulator [Actinobacteria bacterium]|nr:TetR/AcrR family transcriptional regulator [Actinomycetota bacterium]
MREPHTPSDARSTPSVLDHPVRLLGKCGREFAVGTDVSAVQRAAGRLGELFYGAGIPAVGVDTLVERTDVSKMTLYNNFGSKDELVAAYLRDRDERRRAWLLDELERCDGTATDRLLAVFDACDVWMRREAVRGCAFINAFAELPDPDHPARQVVAAQKQWIRELFARLALDAGASDPRALGERLLVLEEGATVAGAVSNVDDAWRSAREMAAALVTSRRGPGDP